MLVSNCYYVTINNLFNFTINLQYGALISTSIPIEVKGEYSSCLKNLLSLITDTANNADQSCKVEVQELRDEIIRVEEEISSHKKYRL